MLLQCNMLKATDANILRLHIQEEKKAPKLRISFYFISFHLIYCCFYRRLEFVVRVVYHLSLSEWKAKCYNVKTTILCLCISIFIQLFFTFNDSLCTHSFIFAPNAKRQTTHAHYRIFTWNVGRLAMSHTRTALFVDGACRCWCQGITIKRIHEIWLNIL